MKVSPGLLAIVYLAMGALFVNLAIKWADDTVWNAATIALALIATLDFGVGIRFTRIHFKTKHNKSKKK